MTNKQSQITIFILLGIVIIIAVGLIFYINSQSEVKESEIQQVTEFSLESRPIKQFIESCIKNIGQEGIELVSRQGGYYTVPEESINNVSYYYHLGYSSIPALFNPCT